MAGLYDLIAEAIGEEEDPRAAAKLVLEIIRDEAADLPAAGVTEGQWTAVFDAFLRSAETADADRNAAETQLRSSEWPAFRAEMEKLGCEVTRIDPGAELWGISASGVHVELNLQTGVVTGFCEADHLVSLGGLASSIRRDVESKVKQKADEARKKQLRLTHQWDNKRKAWVPRDAAA